MLGVSRRVRCEDEAYVAVGIKINQRVNIGGGWQSDKRW